MKMTEEDVREIMKMTMDALKLSELNRKPLRIDDLLVLNINKIRYINFTYLFRLW